VSGSKQDKNKPKRYMFEQVVGEVLKGRLEPPIVVASAAVSKKTRPTVIETMRASVGTVR
jgi:hypothetical protein